MSGSQHLLLGAVPQVVSDPYFEYTTLLLPGNGTNGAQNNTFLDSSTNAFSITRNGNTTQGTFSPFSQTGWGNYFDGAGDYLTIGTASGLNFGTGDFTLETWFYLTSTANTDQGIMSDNGGSFAAGSVIFKARQNFFSGHITVQAYDFNSGGTPLLESTTVVVPNTWYHVAVVRSGNSFSLYVNGAREDTETFTGSINFNNNSGTNIGRSILDGASGVLTGYLSNLRAIKGTAQYSGTTLTVPTVPLTAVTNTSLLTCQSNRFIDNSTNTYTITRNGDVSVQAFSPFNPTAAWSAATNGGSGYFDGSGDYLSVADAAAFTLGTSDFCMESWVYPTNASTGASESILGQWSSASYGWIFQYRSNALLMYYSTNGSSVTNAINASATVVNNAWNHIAFVRSGNTLSAYVNGTRVSTNASFTASIVNSSSTIDVGRNGDNSEYVTGYLNGTRLVVGSSVYDPSQSSITVPTSPLTAVTNTSLLCNFTNAGIYDATSKNDLETIGNAQISTGAAKWGSTSMYFDGTGDYLTIPDSPALRLGTGDFTIEGWFYTTTTSGARCIFYKSQSNTNGVVLLINNGSAGSIDLLAGNGSWSVILSGSSAISTNTWTHLAAVRYGDVWKVFSNGVELATTTNSVAAANTTEPATIGYFRSANPFEWNGYMQDVRITKGYARYTANFTPPAASFPLL